MKRPTRPTRETVRLVLAASVLLAAAAVPAAPAGAGQAPQRSFRELASEVAQVRYVQSVRELRVSWTNAGAESEAAAEPAGATGAAGALRLLGEVVTPGALRRERRPQLSYDRLVVVVQDAAGRELDWRLVQNPAIVRAGAPGPDGRFQGRVIELEAVELAVAVPDMPGADRVQFYRPRWTGAEYMLEPLGQVQLER